jgi:voltage-gated potassium channel
MMLVSGFRGAVTAFLAVVVLGVGGYRVIEGYSWLDACYMTVITLTTVGYREVQPLSVRGQIFTMLLLVGGVGIVFYTAVAMVEKAVAGEFQQFFGRRRMQKRIDALTDHYLVCGFGRIGEVVCRELATKPVSFVVLEQQEERIREAEAAQYIVVQGDATDEKDLVAAGIMKAKGLFATLPSDADNVFVILTGRELNPSLFIVARAEADRTTRRLLHAGANKVISPYAMGGHRMAQAALRPAVVDIIDLATHSQSLVLQMEEIGVPASSPCKGLPLRDSGLYGQPGVIVVAIKRASGKMLVNPAPTETVEVGDSLIALAEAPQLKDLERRVRGE